MSLEKASQARYKTAFNCAVAIHYDDKLCSMTCHSMEVMRKLSLYNHAARYGRYKLLHQISSSVFIWLT